MHLLTSSTSIGARHSPSELSSALAAALVAVLQFKNRFYESQKLTLYLYINIEVFLGYRVIVLRTATLQQVQHLGVNNDTSAQ
jgi:hypothetical protein